MTKPRLFIGSSSESIAVASALELELHDVARVDRWDLSLRVGHFTFDELIRHTSEVDFAVFVVGREDSTESRGHITPSPRDNVIFEAGLFAAAIGRNRTFFVVDKNGTKIPSDWAGLGYLVFDSAEERARDKIVKAAATIRECVSRFGCAKHSVGGVPAGHWWQFIPETEEGIVLSMLAIVVEEGNARTITIHGTGWQGDGSHAARFRSRAATFDERNRKLCYYWAGEHAHERALSLFGGVGEIDFTPFDSPPVKGSGFYTISNLTAPDRTRLKATRYIRATSEEIEILDGSSRDRRMALIQSKLRARLEFDT